MMISRHQQVWEELGEMDPFWSILSNPSYRFGKWNVDAFFRSGADDIAKVMQWIAQHGVPAGRTRALDFGCGVGRLTRALAVHFQHVYGLDISSSMLARASELNVTIPNCEFLLAEPGLSATVDASCDLVYCVLVLQHVPTRRAREQYLREFMRVLKPGGLLIFQLPHFIPPPFSWQPQRRLYGVLRRLGLSGPFIYHRLRLQPIVNRYTAERDVLMLLRTLGARVLEIARYRSGVVQDRIYFVTKG